MARNRVLSFVSQFSSASRTPAPLPSPPEETATLSSKPGHDPILAQQIVDQERLRPITPTSPPASTSSAASSSKGSAQTRRRASSRPASISGGYQPPLMEVNEDTLPELQPVFSLLNSHSNKLYQEGYFLKLEDQNNRGEPNADRTWTECFAQLVGTVLSLWDAGELDAAGENGEVLPKFINLTDASLKMIDSLPTRSNDEQPLQNILSLSTAGRNRYLLHFNSHHSLVQWTAGIRLAMFEHSTLQEAYTGALIAGKGKTLNNINIVMERSRFKTEEWVRVRFGAGVPWRRCWCVISPPDEKEYLKLQKEIKKRSPYDRSQVPMLKGDIKFYDQRTEGKKLKKAQPIASIIDAYSAFAIYPQAKSLIDASTLIKIEGNIAVHSNPPSSAEGFVFVMPETRPAVSGFETMLRFLFPTWDTFCLYGRPGRLVASTLDNRSLMFAMPKHKRYGYLELLDVSSLIVENKNSPWNERDWRKHLKEATGERMNAVEEGVKTHARSGSNQNSRLSFGADRVAARSKVGFADDNMVTRASRSHSLTSPPRTDSAPPQVNHDRQGQFGGANVLSNHTRNSSDSNIAGGGRYELHAPPHGSPQRKPVGGYLQGRVASDGVSSSDEERVASPPVGELGGTRSMQTPEPVSRPPLMNHAPQARPTSKVYHAPELRRANSRLSSTTLAQLAKAGGVTIPRDANDSPHREMDGERMDGPLVQPHARSVGTNANDNRSREAMNFPVRTNSRGGPPPPLNLAGARSQSPMIQSPHLQSPSLYGSNSSRPGTSEGQRPAYPPGSYKQPPPRSPLPQHGYAQAGQLPIGHSRPSPQAGGQENPAGRRPLPGPNSGRGFNQGPDPGFGGRGGPAMFSAGGRGGGDQKALIPERSASLDNPNSPYRDSVTPNVIIDHYTSENSALKDQQRQQSPSTGSQPPRPPPHQAFNSGGPRNDEFEDRPRAGKMKTVGGAEIDPTSQPQLGLPDVNFGPTINYGAPAYTRGQKGFAPGPPGHPERPYSPAGRESPKPQVMPPSHMRQGGEEPPQRIMAWQPAAGAPSAGGQSLSPEQYVQHRAAANSSAPYAHARSPSGSSLGDGNIGARQPRKYFDAAEHRQHTRNHSTEAMSRPSSRGANSAMDSSHLSAREQEQMARMVGGPLVNIGSNQQPSQPGSGLVSTIDARERERQNMRQEANSQAAYQSMNRQQQMSSTPMGPQGNWGAGGHSQYGGFPQAQPPNGPGAGPPASFSRPLRAEAQSSMEVDPRSVPPPGQYAARSGTPTNSRVHPQYQGQAF